MLKEALKAISEDKTSGASELVQRAVSVVMRFSREVPKEELADALLEARPDMAPIINLALEIRRGGDPAETAEAFSHLVKKWFMRAVKETAEELEKYDSVMTYSRSGTVLAAFLHLKSQRRTPRVLLTEGRPGLEGLKLARELAEAGFEVVLGTDAEAGVLLEEAEAVVVGADAVGPEEFFNKVGTKALALLARERGVPFYVAVSRDKVLSAEGLRHYRVKEMDPKEVAHLPGVRVINLYFEPVPLRLASRIIGV